jgi:hypothetical protein
VQALFKMLGLFNLASKPIPAFFQFNPPRTRRVACLPILHISHHSVLQLIITVDTHLNMIY